jgi:hypothetical protein
MPRQRRQHVEEDAPPVQMDAGPYRREPMQRNASQAKHPSEANLRKQAVPRAKEQLKMNNRSERHAIKDNMMKVILDNSQAQKHKQAQQDKNEKETKVEIHRNYGKVPKYINKYNQ